MVYEILCKLRISFVSSVKINYTSNTCPSYFKIAKGVLVSSKLVALQTRTLPNSSPSATSYTSSLVSSLLTAISLTWPLKLVVISLYFSSTYFGSQSFKFSSFKFSSFKFSSFKFSSFISVYLA